MPRRLAIIAMVVALLVAIGAFTGFRLFQTANSITTHATLGDVIGLAQNQDDQPGTLAYKIHHGVRVNILMLGYGGGGHEGAYLTDSIMMISVQGPDRVAMTSLPRDSYAQMKVLAGGQEYDGKINAAYEIPLAKNALGKPAAQYDTGFDGAGNVASKIIGDYLGVTIDYWVGVDFTAFKKVVDAIGGVDINVPTVLDDYAYPTDNFGYQHIHFDPGMQHMDGTRALIYVRERHADNDFGRSRRQQQVTAAIKDKVQQPSVIAQVYSLMDALKDNVHTNMSLNDIKVFGGITSKISNADTHHVSIDDTNWQYAATGYDGAYLLMPRDGTLTSLHNYIQAEMVDPSVLAENARVQFASTYSEGAGGDSLAGIFGATMHMLNFNVAAPAVAQVAPATTVVHDYSGGRAAKTAAWMAQYYGGTVVTEDPSTAPAAPDASPLPGATPVTADIVVTLGRDVAKQFVANPPGGAYYSGRSSQTYVAPTYAPRKVSPSPLPTPTVQPTSQPTVVPTPSPTPTRKPPTCPPVCPTPSPHISP